MTAESGAAARATSRDVWLEHRAWELARHELERKSRRWYDQVIRVLESTKTVSINEVYRSGPGVGAAMAKEGRGRRLGCLQFAVSDVVQAFSPEERERLREQDELPPDFVAKVLKQAKVVRSQVMW